MTRTFLALILSLLAACGDDGGGATDAAPRDTSTSPDGTTVQDAGADDGGVDAGSAADTGVTLDAATNDAATEPPPARDRLMYVSVGGDARLAVAELAADGTMAALAGMDLTLPGNPGAVTYARTARRLYVGVRDDDIATVSLDTDGRPSLVGLTNGTGFPVYLELARDEGVLVSAHFGADQLRTHDVTGAPPHAETDLVATTEEPHASTLGPNGLIYVPHRNGNLTAWYDLAPDGTLTLASSLTAAPGVGPRHIAFTPDGAFAYVVHEFGDSVGAHRVLGDGNLEHMDTVSTLPAAANGDTNTCADIHVSRDGRFVYASNRGHDSIAMFAIETDGTLTFLGTEPTEARPREFAMSPDGRFLVVAGQDSGFLASYRTTDTGTLTMLDRLEVGPDLRWVIID